MKNLILTLVLLMFPISISVQLIDSVHILSTGHNDRSHATTKLDMSNTYITEFGYFAFERVVNDSSSKVMLQKIGYFGLMDAPLEVSISSGLNASPSIAYRPAWDGSANIPIDVFIVWQEFSNSSWNIKGRHLNANTGWSDIIDISSQTGFEVRPQTANKTSKIFIITYEREGNIFYREFNSETSTLSSEENLTANISDACFNSRVVHTSFDFVNTTFVSYERIYLAGSFKLVEYISSSQPGVWSNPVELPFGHHNYNVDINYSYSGIEFVYMRPQLGAYYLRIVVLEPNGNSYTKFLPSMDIEADYYSYAESGVIVTNDIAFSMSGHVCEYIFDSTGYQIKINYDQQTVTRSILNPEGSFKPFIRVTESFFGVPYHVRNWFLINYQEAGQYESRIAGIIFENTVTNLSNQSENIPDKFSLHQNFPNPFNPTTTISFDIPKVSDVKLTVFDALGREVAVLVNEHLSAGSYNYQLSIDNFQMGSGVYFYSLKSDDIVETKRMLLLK